MRVIVSHGRTKRIITGGFNLCGSADDIKAIVTALSKGLQGEDEFVYGWIEVPDTQKPLEGIPPKDWD